RLLLSVLCDLCVEIPYIVDGGLLARGLDCEKCIQTRWYENVICNRSNNPSHFYDPGRRPNSITTSASIFSQSRCVLYGSIRRSMRGSLPLRVWRMAEEKSDSAG